ncbi:hypothetical protein T4A_13989, partial [Trichinella pseudospiralis]
LAESHWKRRSASGSVGEEYTAVESTVLGTDALLSSRTWRTSGTLRTGQSFFTLWTSFAGWTLGTFLSWFTILARFTWWTLDTLRTWITCFSLFADDWFWRDCWWTLGSGWSWWTRLARRRDDWLARRLSRRTRHARHAWSTRLSRFAGTASWTRRTGQSRNAAVVARTFRLFRLITDRYSSSTSRQSTVSVDLSSGSVHFWEIFQIVHLGEDIFSGTFAKLQLVRHLHPDVLDIVVSHWQTDAHGQHCGHAERHRRISDELVSFEPNVRFH